MKKPDSIKDFDKDFDCVKKQDSSKQTQWQCLLKKLGVRQGLPPSVSEKHEIEDVEVRRKNASKQRGENKHLKFKRNAIFFCWNYLKKCNLSVQRTTAFL